jgi:hypothetical protein
LKAGLIFTQTAAIRDLRTSAEGAASVKMGSKQTLPPNKKGPPDGGPFLDF